MICDAEKVGFSFFCVYFFSHFFSSKDQETLRWFAEQSLLHYVNEEGVSASLLCAICMSPLLSPVSLSACEHMFCRSCLEQLPKKECPCDRLPFDKAVSAPKVVHTLCDELLVECIHELCNETMKRGDLMVHLRNKCVLKGNRYEHNIKFELEKVREYASLASEAVPTSEEDTNIRIDKFAEDIRCYEKVVMFESREVARYERSRQDVREELLENYLSKNYDWYLDQLEESLEVTRDSLRLATNKLEDAKNRIAEYNRCIEILKYLKDTTTRCLEPIIHINAKGTHVYTTRKALCSNYPESDLAAFFSKVTEEEVTVDRDGASFAALINWLTDGCQPRDVTSEIVREASFWKISLQERDWFGLRHRLEQLENK
jgi:flagellar biosynthesis chaperone FliJ